jgi:hypothetical protein
MRSSPLLRLTTLLATAGLAACGTATGTSLSGPNKGCTACHGDSTRSGTALQQAAPPKDAHGSDVRTQVTVGAHQAHVYGGVACSTCHQVPPAGDLTHIDGTALVAFAGNVVGANGITVAPWNPAQPTCANYCHGGRPGGSAPMPSWTVTPPLDCGSCHRDQAGRSGSLGHQLHVLDLPPGELLDCAACHGTGYAAAGVTGAAAATHVDGALQVLPAVGWQTPCNGPRTCAATCHAAAALPCRSWQ